MTNRETVITLPITPTSSPSVGLLIPPLVANFLATRTGMTGVVALNPFGRKLSSSESVQRLADFGNILELAGFGHLERWSDGDPEYRLWVSKQVEQLLKREVIYPAPVTCSSCECGRVELPREAQRHSRTRAVISGTGETQRCTVCGSGISERTYSGLRLQLKTDRLNAGVFPQCSANECLELWHRVEGFDHVVSRRAATGTEAAGFHIDTDFAWQMYLAYQAQNGRDVRVIVGSTRTLWATVMAAKMALVLGVASPKLVITPYVYAPKGQRMAGETYDASLILGSSSAMALRLAMLASLTWKSKVATFDPRLIELYNKMAYRMVIPDANRVDLDATLERLEVANQTLRDALRLARSTRDAYSSDAFVGV